MGFFDQLIDTPDYQAKTLALRLKAHYDKHAHCRSMPSWRPDSANAPRTQIDLAERTTSTESAHSAVIEDFRRAKTNLQYRIGSCGCVTCTGTCKIIINNICYLAGIVDTVKQVPFN